MSIKDLSIVVGKVTVNATVMDSNGISEIKWYVNGNLSEKNDEELFEWTLDDPDDSDIIKIHRIKVIAYDNAKNKENDEITVLKFF